MNRVNTKDLGLLSAESALRELVITVTLIKQDRNVNKKKIKYVCKCD